MGEKKILEEKIDKTVTITPPPVYRKAVDKGLEGVSVCKTAISRIKDGRLFYRGFSIEDLAQNSHFEEVLFLLWNNKLPSTSELESFKEELNSHLSFQEDFLKHLKNLPHHNVHPMAWLRTAVSLLSLCDPESEDSQKSTLQKATFRLTAQMGQLIALFDRLRRKQDPVVPVKNKSLAWNFLHSLSGEEPSDSWVKIFDTCLILHADHEMNCSTFSARVTHSTLSDVYSSIVSAMGTLKGPLHGGANERVMKTLQDIGSLDRAKAWLKEALALKRKIMGFGHRVYKKGDPRAVILRKMSQDITQQTSQSQWFEISRVLEEEMKKTKNLLPNVDFYSATIYHSMGVPSDLYTPIFAASRIGGWLAHLREQGANNRLYRPLSDWVGKEDRLWKPLEQRLSSRL